MLESLKREVLEANLNIAHQGLAKLTWGNVSGLDREKGLMVIKPSGVAYSELVESMLVVMDLEGKVVEGNLRPSSDAPTHTELYKAFPSIGGVTHSHSAYAVIFAQAGKEIPCFGTTHADHFLGPVPLTRHLTSNEAAGDYERNTAHVIVERFQGLEPEDFPGVLVSGHGPFSWGKSAVKALENAVALEACAHMAYGTLQLNPLAETLPAHLLQKHYYRKHGKAAYYGQK